MSAESEAVKRRSMSEDNRREQLPGVVKEPKGGRAAGNVVLDGKRAAGGAALDGRRSIGGERATLGHRRYGIEARSALQREREALEGELEAA